ncbi:MAG: glycosyltransferase family 39 protein [Hyphomonadaceae bacterium]|nr:glycosyltransferase family 39 protein [Hyphomonadaceae bacterium]
MAAIEHDAARPAARRGFSAIDATAGLLIVLSVYLVLHMALRIWASPLIGKNDVQEAVSAQAWLLGYHPRNPPLHTWLVMGAYAVFGPTTLAHVVLKHVLLGAAYVFAYLCGREVLSTPKAAFVAAVSLTLLGPFAWTVHTALTHTLLLAVAVLAALWTAMRLSARRRLIDYIVFGLAMGFGFLAKYSFSLFFVALVAAMMSVRDLRRTLMDWRILASLAAALIVFAPHGLWMLGARFDFVAFLAEKQRTADVVRPYAGDVGRGLGNIALGALTFTAPMVLTAPFVLWRLRGAPPAAPSSAWGRALGRICLAGLTILVLDVFVLRATEFELRYFTCALLAAPMAAAYWIDQRNGGGGAWRVVLVSVALVTLVGVGGVIGKALWDQQSCDRCWDEMRADRLEDALRTEGFTRGTIVADHYNLAGNLRLAFPNARIVAANYEVGLPRQSAEGMCVLAWNARTAGDALPADLTAYARQTGLAPLLPQPRYVEGLLRRSATRMDRFGYMIVTGADGACRPR